MRKTIKINNWCDLLAFAERETTTAEQLFNVFCETTNVLLFTKAGEESKYTKEQIITEIKRLEEFSITNPKLKPMGVLMAN
jgi:hypothetical protein